MKVLKNKAMLKNSKPFLIGFILAFLLLAGFLFFAGNKKREMNSELLSNLFSKEKKVNLENNIDEKGSPFGFHPGMIDGYSYMYDLGVSWSRGEGQYVIWDWIDSKRNGEFNFTNVVLPAPPSDENIEIVNREMLKVDYDELHSVTPDDINIVRNICPFRKVGGFRNENDKKVYAKFVESVVERYDGDDDLGCIYGGVDCYAKGDGQYPDKEIIAKSKANPIKFWQVCNQLFDTCNGLECEDNYAKNYAEAVRITYEAAKKADPEVSILIAGDSFVEEYPAVFEELKGKYIDIVDKHYFGNADCYDPAEEFDYLKKSLVESGFSLDKIKFWVTETGTYSGYPVGRMADGYQSETDQANSLLKRYISSFGYGIEKVFWAWNIVEGFKKDGEFFDYTGLIYDGCDFVDGRYQCGKNLTYDLGKGEKKLSYYTYKLMVEKLDGFDNNQVEVIVNSDGVRVYKFKNEKTGKNTWVAWGDNDVKKMIQINVGNLKDVTVTEAIANYETGKEIDDYLTAFKKQKVISDKGVVKIELNQIPIFIN